MAVGEFQRVNEIVKRSGEFVEAQQRVADGDLDFVYDEMEVELAKVSREFDIASLLPGSPDAALGHRGIGRDR